MKDNTTKRINRLSRRKLITLLGTTGALGLLGFSKRIEGFFTVDNKQMKLISNN
jgi:hypothetical protein